MTVREELRTVPVEPLLPVEKKLIVWSLKSRAYAPRRVGGDQSLLSGGAVTASRWSNPLMG